MCIFFRTYVFKAYDETAGVSLITAGATCREVPETYGANEKK